MFASMDLRSLVTYDGDVCLGCWGLVPRDGVTYVPDDGDLCECGHVQHNEPNPILIVFRKQRSPLTPLRAHIWGMLSGLDRLMLEVVDGQMIGAAHVHHARKVLIRLRNLTENTVPDRDTDRSNLEHERSAR